MNLVLSLLMFASAGAANAQSVKTVDISSRFVVRDAETSSVTLGQQTYVRNLIVQARGVSTASTVEVMVNGQVKGTIYAPGADPSYVVTVEAMASSIEFRHRQGGSMEILNIKAALVTAYTHPVPKKPKTPQDEVHAIANEVIALIKELQPYADLMTEKDHLLPIKLKAGEVRVMNASHGPLSIRTRQALESLQQQIQTSDPYIETVLARNGLFELGIALLTVKESIRDWLD